MRAFSSILAASVAAGPLAYALPSARSTTTTTHMTVDPSTRHQLIEGFGFSGAFQRAQLLLNVSSTVQQELLDLLYSPQTGIGFSMLRNGIGSSNSSFNDWMNSHLPFSPGAPDAEPDYVWDDYDSGQLFLAQQAVAYGVERIYGNAWSSPGFMKNNSNDANGGLLCGVPGSFDGEDSQCAGQDWRGAYAAYLVKYIELYADAGVPVTDIGWLNEPDLTTSYASMRSNAEQTADFLPILRAALDKSGHEDVGIACCEHTGWDETAEHVAELQALGVEDLLTTWTGHEYSGNITGPLATDKRVWQSEYCDLADDWNPDWDTGVNDGDGYRWAYILHNALTVGNVNSYFWWLALQDEATNDNNNEKLILVEAGEYELSKRVWSFAHFARYIRPGARRIGVESGDVLGSAYVNEDGSSVVVVLNPLREGRALEVALGDCEVAEGVKAYVTDQENDMREVQVAWDLESGVAKVDVPPRGLVTLKAT